jgi:hypothetical protein
MKKPFPHLHANGEKRNGTYIFLIPYAGIIQIRYKGVISARTNYDWIVAPQQIIGKNFIIDDTITLVIYITENVLSRRSRDCQDVLEDCPEMAEASCHNKEMPNFVKAENTGNRIRAF